ncbi:Hypothetical predicted protein [Podarcis lilfordi]|uniref:Uncharacterized protein n=1 Tax=Podarcis lilfordi TaxID=74358 RepID=A0AA35PEY4_9SAUR|nr:Hypothetical predicted protein [Podarcis lilfordi]
MESEEGEWLRGMKANFIRLIYMALLKTTSILFSQWPVRFLWKAHRQGLKVRGHGFSQHPQATLVLANGPSSQVPKWPTRWEAHKQLVHSASNSGLSDDIPSVSDRCRYRKKVRKPSALHQPKEQEPPTAIQTKTPAKGISACLDRNACSPLTGYLPPLSHVLLWEQ